MDFLTHFGDIDDRRTTIQQELDLNDWLDSQEPPATEPQPKVCSWCQNYVSPRTFANGVKAWGYCGLKTGDGWEATSLEPWSQKAQTCRWFVWLQEF